MSDTTKIVLERRVAELRREIATASKRGYHDRAEQLHAELVEHQTKLGFTPDDPPPKPKASSAGLVEPAFTKTNLERNSKTALSTLDAYADQRKRVEKVFRQEIARGDEPRAVAEIVFHALTAPSPRLRHPVGKSVVLSRLRRFAPARLFDPTFRSQFQLDEPIRR